MSETQVHLMLAPRLTACRLVIIDGVCGLYRDNYVCLPRRAQCNACLEAGELDWPGWLERHNGHASASRDHILSVALFCGALAGALDTTTRALIADHVAGDADALPVLLDRAELLGLDGPAAQWAKDRQVWLEVDPHGTGNNPHVWRPVMRVIGERRWASPVWSQCSCGAYEPLFEARRQRIDLPMGLRAEQVWVDEPREPVEIEMRHSLYRNVGPGPFTGDVD